MVDKSQTRGEYRFHILGQHSQTKTTTNGKKKLTASEVATATILARYKYDGKVHETIIPKVPLFLWDAFNCLNKSEFNNELFRKSGSTKRITDFFNKNPSIFQRGTMFHGLTQLDVGTLMKDFLRERFEPLFLSNDPLLGEIEPLVKLGIGIEFDAEHNPEFGTLLFVVKVLHSLCLKDVTGRMTPSNLAVYFTPIFIQDPKEVKQNMNKVKLARHINLLTMLIQKSQNLIVKSTYTNRFRQESRALKDGVYRSNSITPGVSIRDEECRRASSVIGRLMRYVNKEKIPRIVAVPIDSLVAKDNTPEGRQSRPRSRRTPNSSAKKPFRLTPKISVGETLRQDETPTHRYSQEKPRMRDVETTEYLMEARKRLDFNVVDENVCPDYEKPLPLDEILTNFERSVEELPSDPAPTPVPCDPAIPILCSPQYAKGLTPKIDGISSPEVLMAELINTVVEAHPEMESVCKEMAAQNTAFKHLRKEMKDQSCSPILLLSRGITTEPSPLILQEFKSSPRRVSSPIKSAPAPITKAPTSNEFLSSPANWRTKSGGFDWSTAATIVRSRTQDELISEFGGQFPVHRPSIALLAQTKQVSKNIARLEKAEEILERKESIASQRLSGSGGATFAKPTIASGSKVNPKSPVEFKIPTLPKSKSTGSSATTSMGTSTRRFSTGKFAVPKLPLDKAPRLPTSKPPPESVRTVRTDVPSYAASTFSSIQHAISRQESQITIGEKAITSQAPTASSRLITFEEDNEQTTDVNTLSPLHGISTLISKLSLSSLDTV